MYHAYSHIIAYRFICKCMCAHSRTCMRKGVNTCETWEFLQTHTQILVEEEAGRGMKNKSLREIQLNVFLCLQGPVFSISIICHRSGEGEGGAENPAAAITASQMLSQIPSYCSQPTPPKNTSGVVTELSYKRQGLTLCYLRMRTGLMPKQHLYNIQRLHFKAAFCGIRISRQRTRTAVQFHFPLLPAGCFTLLKSQLELAPTLGKT